MKEYDIDELYVVRISPIKKYNNLFNSGIRTVKKEGHISIAIKVKDRYYDLITDRVYDYWKDDYAYLKEHLNEWMIHNPIIPMRIALKEAKEYLTIDEIRNLYYIMNNKKKNNYSNMFYQNTMKVKKFIEDNFDGNKKNMYLDKLANLATYYTNYSIRIENNNDAKLIYLKCSQNLEELTEEINADI